MADKILHKRSLTPGSIPTTSSLDIGELAINVNDGKLYLHQSGSIAEKIITVGESASYASTASYVQTAQTASYVLNAVSSSFAASSSFALTASYLEGGVTIDTGSLVTTASFNAYTGSNTSQFAGTSSYALTASYVAGASSFPYTGSALITGSLSVTGSVTATSFIGDGSGLTGIGATARQSDYTSSVDPNINYLYLGYADFGSSLSADVWTISRLSISSSGDTLTQTTSSAAWTNRYSYTYS
jgi:hypothetical protein